MNNTHRTISTRAAASVGMVIAFALCTATRGATATTPVTELVLYGIDADTHEFVRYVFDTDTYTRIGVVVDQNGYVIDHPDGSRRPHAVGPHRGARDRIR